MAIELIGAHSQTLWGTRAVANFVLGGLGAGLYVVAAVVSGFGPSPALAIASWLGPILVLTGFAAVASEAGRPLRGARVLARARTSWMSRELWAGGAFVLLAAGGLVHGSSWQRRLGVIAALAVALSQGMIVRRARGIAAWNVPVVPPLFVLSALVSGAGVLALVETGLRLSPGPGLLRVMAALLALDLLAWLAYLMPRGDEAFVAPTRALRDRAALLVSVGGGHVVPFLLITLALALPDLAEPALAVAALLMIDGQIRMKAELILTAGQLRPITIDRLRLPGAGRDPAGGQPGWAGKRVAADRGSETSRRRPA